MSEIPALSVVILAVSSPAAVDRLVRSIGPRLIVQVEILVVAEAGNCLDADVEIVACEADSPVPSRRMLGLSRARAPFVVFLEDTSVCESNWLEAWLAASMDGRVDAASGPVSLDPGVSGVAAAVYFCEYARYAPGSTPCPAGHLSGNHFGVRRVALADTEAIHETELSRALREAGRPPSWVAGARVRHVESSGFNRAARDRLRFGLDYGLGRGRHDRSVGRWTGPLIGLGIWPIQVGRLVGLAARSKHPWPLRQFAASLPLTLLLLSFWSLGEWAGWTLGLAVPAARRRRAGSARPAARPTVRVESRPDGCTTGRGAASGD
jgi:hypothetical protein